MKKLLSIFLTVGIWSFLGTGVFAMCMWFAPPGRIFEPAESINTLIIEQNGQQKMIVQPQFGGNADDFALVMPFVGKPDITEAPEAIFTELTDLTNPEIFFNDFSPAALEDSVSLFESRSGVTVIEQREVGDYEATTLSATDGGELLSWLQDNGYEVPDEKQETLDYYVEGDARYFVALKVNASAVELEDDNSLSGELRPIEFSFKGDAVMLPLRLMAGEEGRMNLVIYTLSQSEWYIPGAELQFARKVSAADLEQAPALQNYDARGMWLVRNSIQFNPAAAKKDITLSIAGEPVIVQDGLTVRLNADELERETGLIESTRGQLQYIENAASPAEQAATVAQTTNNDSSLVLGLTIASGLLNIVLLNMLFGRSKKVSNDQEK